MERRKRSTAPGGNRTHYLSIMMPVLHCYVLRKLCLGLLKLDAPVPDASSGCVRWTASSTLSEVGSAKTSATASRGIFSSAVKMHN